MEKEHSKSDGSSIGLSSVIQNHERASMSFKSASNWRCILKDTWSIHGGLPSSFSIKICWTSWTIHLASWLPNNVKMTLDRQSSCPIQKYVKWGYRRRLIRVFEKEDRECLELADNLDIKKSISRGQLSCLFLREGRKEKGKLKVERLCLPWTN